MVVQSSRMQRTRTIAAAIKKYLLRTSLLHSRYLFSVSICLSLSFSPSFSRYSYYSRLCAFIDSFTHLLINLFIHLFILSFIHSYSHLFIFSFIHLLSFYHIHTARTLSLSIVNPFSSYFTTPYICLPTYTSCNHYHHCNHRHRVIIYIRSKIVTAFFPIMAGQSSV